MLRPLVPVLAALCVVLSACGPDEGDLWDGDTAALAGTWRARDDEPQGRPWLLMDPSEVYRVLVESGSQAIEVERGSFTVEGGRLIRVSTRNINPHLVGERTENGVYRVTDEELVLEPEDPGGAQIFYLRVAAPPEYRALP